MLTTFLLGNSIISGIHAYQSKCSDLYMSFSEDCTRYNQITSIKHQYVLTVWTGRLRFYTNVCNSTAHYKSISSNFKLS